MNKQIVPVVYSKEWIIIHIIPYKGPYKFFKLATIHYNHLIVFKYHSKLIEWYWLDNLCIRILMYRILLSCIPSNSFKLHIQASSPTAFEEYLMTLLCIKFRKLLTVVSSSWSTWSYSDMATQKMIAVTSSKQCIHFLRSDRCPPTSNNLKKKIIINLYQIYIYAQISLILCTRLFHIHHIQNQINISSVTYSLKYYQSTHMYCFYLQHLITIWFDSSAHSIASKLAHTICSVCESEQSLNSPLRCYIS